MSARSSALLVREVSIKFMAWDVILTDLHPGAHTLHRSVRDETEVYGGVVYIMVEDQLASK